MKYATCLFLAFSLVSNLTAQKDFYRDYPFSEADTLRGALRSERTCYDVTYYALDIRIDPERRYLEGFVDIAFTALEDFTTLQIDLFANMKINRISMDGRELAYRRRFNAVFVECPRQHKGDRNTFRVHYEGTPQAARNPPWDGGFVWSADKYGRPWVGVACEGDGASLWWPNKDHLSDEPDSMSIRVAVPRDLTCVANGILRGTLDQGSYQRWDWFVSYPINNYNVTVNIARYKHWSDFYIAGDGDTLDLDYYVLPYNETKARKHFEQAKPTLACYERFFDKYPFWKDGFALVETPYLGMEHQSAIAYGNQYMRGYMGGMIPRDMNWDYIIVHETAHEYFGNSVSCNDLAEMWIHEGFATYMEALFVECEYSYADALRYLAGQRFYINNQEPVIGPEGVNWEDWEGSDHYYKGAWLLQTLRSAINNDSLWFVLLKDFYRKFAISHATTSDFNELLRAGTGRDWTAVLSQYLEYPSLPVFRYALPDEGGQWLLRYKWDADVKGFDLPLLVGKPGAYQRIRPTTEWQELELKGVAKNDFRVAEELFLIQVKKE